MCAYFRMPTACASRSLPGVQEGPAPRPGGRNLSIDQTTARRGGRDRPRRALLPAAARRRGPRGAGEPPGHLRRLHRTGGPGTVAVLRPGVPPPRGRAGLGPHLADGVPRGADRRGRRLCRLRGRRLVAHRGPHRTGRDPGLSQLLPPPRHAAAHQPGPGEELPLPVPRIHLEPRRHAGGDPGRVGLPARRPGRVRPPRGAGGDVGRVRVRERRPRRCAAGGLPRGPALALRAVAARGPLPHRPRGPGRCPATGRWRSRRSSRRTTRWRCTLSCSRPPPTR